MFGQESKERYEYTVVDFHLINIFFTASWWCITVLWVLVERLKQNKKTLFSVRVLIGQNISLGCLVDNIVY